jgi:hypothetical protein
MIFVSLVCRADALNIFINDNQHISFIQFVIPAQAGICIMNLDSCLRRNDNRISIL